MIGGGQPVGEAVALLEKADAAIVLIDGKPAGVLTRQDLLAHLGAPLTVDSGRDPSLNALIRSGRSAASLIGAVSPAGRGRRRRRRRRRGAAR